MDPNDLLKQVTEQTAARSDAVYLAVVVVILCGTILVSVGYVLVKWMPTILSSFRDEMRLERDHHRKEIDDLRKAIAGRPRSRRQEDDDA